MRDPGGLLMSTLEETSRKLCELSEKTYQNPYTYIDWVDSMPGNQWFMSPSLISIDGTDRFASMDESSRQKLSFFEAINFFSLNIHGEKSLVEGLSKRLYSKELKEYAPYLHHFLDEENKHMIYFGGFCQRYAGKVYRDRKMIIPREYAAGEEDFLFFAKVMIFEELVDVYNMRMSVDESMEAISRKINLIHHLEEARHLVFGRRMVEYLFEKYANTWSTETLASVRQYLGDYLIATWKEYYNPDVYKDAELESPFDLMEAAWNSDRQKAHRKEVSSKVIAFLKEREMILEEPAL